MRSLKQAHEKSPFSVEVRDSYCPDDTYSEINDHGTGKPPRFATVGDAVNWVIEGGDWGFKVYDCDHVLVCAGSTRT
jgi:hypothetical protein